MFICVIKMALTWNRRVTALSRPRWWVHDSWPICDSLESIIPDKFQHIQLVGRLVETGYTDFRDHFNTLICELYFTGLEVSSCCHHAYTSFEDQGIRYSTNNIMSRHDTEFYTRLLLSRFFTSYRFNTTSQNLTMYSENSDADWFARIVC